MLAFFRKVVYCTGIGDIKRMAIRDLEEALNIFIQLSPHGEQTPIMTNWSIAPIVGFSQLGTLKASFLQMEDIQDEFIGHELMIFGNKILRIINLGVDQNGFVLPRKIDVVVTVNMSSDIGFQF